MHDKYVGDVGDFMKCGLIRWLHERVSPEGQGAVIWYATKDAGGSKGDGRHLGYLTNPQFVAADARLLALLREVVTHRRHLEGLEASGALPAGTAFFRTLLDAPAAEREAWRREWLRRARDRAVGSDWVFADPDNGIASERVEVRELRARKYAFLHELEALAPPERTLIAYHHFGRDGSARAQGERLVQRLTATFPEHGAVRLIEARAYSGRFFAVVPARRHEVAVTLALDALGKSGWAGLLEVVS
jgi:hypothetical protein